MSVIERFNLKVGDFQLVSESLKKHGTHDQSSHGNWAKDVSVKSGVATSILERVQANGGLSVNMVDGSEPTGGYMVAKGAKYGSISEAVDFYDPIKGPKILSDYMKKHRNDLATGKNYLGLWHNTADGKVYLDISENIQDKERARSLGARRDQISIWDVANFAEIDTGGTGNVEKTGSNSTSRFIDDDRRADRRVRQDNLEQTRKAVRVIRFEAGLKPLLKHLEGQHDQSTHGSWANQGYSAEDASEISRMSELGPSIDDMNNFLKGEEQPGYQDLLDFVNNDSGLYSDATEDIDARVEERLARLQAEFPLHEYSEQEKATIYEDVQTEMIDRFVQEDDGTIAQLWSDANSDGSVNQGDLLNSFSEVYDMSHTGKTPDGTEITLNSSVENVEPTSDYSFELTGNITDQDGNFAGEFKREFTQNDDGTWQVEHSFLKLEDEYTGTGFGKKFLADSEAWYIARGFSSIKVGTAWDGARHWARAGFDWDAKDMQKNFSELEDVRYSLKHYQDGKYLPEFDALMNNMVTDYDGDFWSWSELKPWTSLPTPAHFALIGYKDKTTDAKGQSDWAGKYALYGKHMAYRKSLKEPDSRDVQTPIDRDGDGIVFDGTPRARQATAEESPKK